MSLLTGKSYTGFLEDEIPTEPIYILAYSIAFFTLSLLFSHLWGKRFKNGPLETLIRRFSG